MSCFLLVDTMQFLSGKGRYEEGSVEDKWTGLRA